MPMQTGVGETQPERSTTVCQGAGLCDDLRADGLRKGWGFQSVPGMLAHWQVEQVK